MSDGNEIIRYGDPVLRGKAQPIKRVTREVRAIAERMVTRLEQAGGLGLAAPQVGCGLRLIAYDVGEGPVPIVNPRIERSTGLVEAVEGCLSLPRLYGNVARAERVVVKASDLHGHPITLEAEDLLARVLQHEIDHLEGVLFVDRVNPATLHWLVGDAERPDQQQRVHTTLEDALKVFETWQASRG
jgi:peptide deformylase